MFSRPDIADLKRRLAAARRMLAETTRTAKTWLSKAERLAAEEEKLAELRAEAARRDGDRQSKQLRRRIALKKKRATDALMRRRAERQAELAEELAPRR